MTDDDRTLDELASAHLDGLTTAAEARRIDADPELQARVAAMRAVRDAISAAMPPSAPERRDQAIEAALRAFDDASAAPAGARDVTTLATARASRRSVHPRRLVGIAAAVLLLAIAVPVVAELAGSGDRDEMATSAGDSAESDAAGRDADDATTSAGAEALEEAAGQGSAPMPATAADLGTFATVEAMEEAVRAVLHEQSRYSEAELDALAASDGAVPCAERARAESTPGAAVALAASAVLQDRAVEVVVLAQPDGERTMIVADPARGCEALETRTLTP